MEGTIPENEKDEVPVSKFGVTKKYGQAVSKS